MQKPTVIFAHGRESGPWGTKIRALARVAEQLGLRAISRDDSDTRDPDIRVARLTEQVAALDGPFILVGSSMGGYVATVASRQVTPVGLFLMAPAFGLPGYSVHQPQPVCRELAVVHGWSDDIVPIAAVLDFSRKNRATLHLIPAGHTLIEQLDWLTEVFQSFLGRCLRPDCSQQRGRLLATF